MSSLNFLLAFFKALCHRKLERNLTIESQVLICRNSNQTFSSSGVCSLIPFSSQKLYHVHLSQSLIRRQITHSVYPTPFFNQRVPLPYSTYVPCKYYNYEGKGLP